MSARLEKRQRENVPGMARLESKRARLAEVGWQITAALPGGHWDSTDG